MGYILSRLKQVFPPKSTFSLDDTPDLTGKVVIVTGANTGIGKETAKALLAHNAKVYIAARDEAKAKAAIKDLKEQTGKDSLFLKLDLADLPSVKAAAKEFESKEKELHILFNNAGVMFPPVELVTPQGYDLTFGTNVLGHFYFTKLLLPLLIAGTKSSSDGKSRVINLSSSGHTLVNNLDFSSFKDSPARRKRFAFSLYGQSKFGNIVFANELDRRYGDQGIVSVSVHPGLIATDLHQYVPNFLRGLSSYMLYPASQGALTSVWAGTTAEGATHGGKYLIPWARVGIPHPNTLSPELGRQLWEWAEEQVENI